MENKKIREDRQSICVRYMASDDFLFARCGCWCTARCTIESFASSNCKPFDCIRVLLYAWCQFLVYTRSSERTRLQRINEIGLEKKAFTTDTHRPLSEYTDNLIFSPCVFYIHRYARESNVLVSLSTRSDTFDVFSDTDTLHSASRHSFCVQTTDVHMHSAVGSTRSWKSGGMVQQRPSPPPHHIDEHEHRRKTH